MKTPATIQIELEPEQALVLYDFLTREIEDHNGSRLIPLASHEGELWSLDELQGLLAKNLVAQFDEDYSTLVSQANEVLVSRRGSWPT